MTQIVQLVDGELTSKDVNISGGSGSTDTYTHNQMVASTTWTIEHNLDRDIDVSIIDSGKNIVYGDINNLTSNITILTFSEAISGKAYCH